MNRTLRNLLLIPFALSLSCAPMLAQYKASTTTRTSVNTNTNYNANVNKNTNVNVNKNTNVNVNTNTNVNVNRNVNVNVNKNVYVHGSTGYYGGACCYHSAPVAAAVATGIVIGMRVATLPPACKVVYVNGLTYQQCGSTWYQPQFVGASPSYVVVVAPR